MTTRQYRDRTKHQNGASITNSSVSLTAGALLQGQGLSGATFPYTVAVYAQDTSGNLTSYEEMDVTAGTYPTLTVTRGINGTTAVAHDTTHIIAQVIGKNDADNWLQAGSTVDIGSDSATIAKVNLTDQGSTPSAPASGHHIIYSKSGGIYAETSAGVETQLAAKSAAGEISAADFAVTGLTGATTASRYAGATGGGAPVSGTFSTGDMVLDVVNARVYICTAGGTPGTWAFAGGGFTNPMSAANDLIVGGTAGAPARLASVSSKFLQTDGSGVISWGSAPAPGSSTLGGDSDVSISSPANLQILQYNGSTWANVYGGAIRLVSTVLAVNTASVSFTSIPGAYSALLIEYVARSTSAGSALDTLLCRFNSDTAANYDYQNATDSGTAASLTETFAATSIRCGLCVQNGAGSGLAAAGTILIPEYADTSFNKTLNAVVSSKTGTATQNMRNERNAGFWRSSSAITQIDLFPGAGSFLAGCKFRLYGIV